MKFLRKPGKRIQNNTGQMRNENIKEERRKARAGQIAKAFHALRELRLGTRRESKKNRVGARIRVHREARRQKNGGDERESRAFKEGRRGMGRMRRRAKRNDIVCTRDVTRNCNEQ